MESPSDTRRATEQIAAGASRILNRPYAFAMASVSALFLALVGLLGQLATRELSVFPALFMRYLASTLVVLIVLRGAALQTLQKVSRLDYLRVGSVLISQFCLFYYFAHGSLLIGMLLYNTGPLFSRAARALASWNHLRTAHRYQHSARVRGRCLGLESFRRTYECDRFGGACLGVLQLLLAACLSPNEPERRRSS